jgi:MFS family permease
MNATNRASSSPALIVALVCVPVFIGALDLTVVSAVLPQVVYDLQIPLQTGLDEAAWMVSGYLLAYTIAMTFMGRLSDLWGRRRVYLLSLAIFALGSFLVAIADRQPAHWLSLAYRLALGHRPDPAQMALWALIASRMVQAFGGGAMVPVSMALAGDLYPPAQRAAPLGFIGAVDTAGWVVGHLYGGIVVRYFDWRLIFWLNLPVCLLAFGLVARALRGAPKPCAEGKFDGLGAVLASVALAGLTLGLGQSSQDLGGAAFGAQSPPQVSWPLLGLAAFCLAMLVGVEWKHPYPLIPVRMFGSLNFSAAAAANFLAGFSLVIAIANVPLFINTLVAGTLQQGAWDSGWMLSGLTLPMAAAALLGGWITPRAGYRLTAAPGLLLAAGGFGLMSGWRIGTPYPVMLGHLMLAGVGFGLVIAPVATAVVNAASASQRGAASALVIIFRLCGMTLGLAAMTTYGLQRADALLELQTAADLGQMVAAGMEVMNQVISETFWIAAAVSALALVPALLLRADSPPSHFSKGN